MPQTSSRGESLEECASLVEEFQLWGNFPDRLRSLLEDFEIVSAGMNMALVPRDHPMIVRNVRAALLASWLGVGLDYAQRRYCQDIEADTDQGVETEQHAAYVATFRAAKDYVARIVDKLHTDGRPPPELGVFGASLVLERLRYSFFAAHFLYLLGHRYEGHAVSRLILEQIAWAYKAHDLVDLKQIQQVRASRAIASLKKLEPVAGTLYGVLSSKTHIDYASHGEFLTVEEGRNVVILAERDLIESAIVLLRLADLFGIVWEVSQYDYVVNPETVDRSGATFIVRQDRPFLAVAQALISDLRDRSDQDPGS